MSSEAEALRPIFADVVSRLQADDVVDKLYAIKLLTHADHEELAGDMKTDLKGVNRRILQAVGRGPAGSTLRFAEIVKTSQPELAADIFKGMHHTTPYAWCRMTEWAYVSMVRPVSYAIDSIIHNS